MLTLQWTAFNHAELECGDAKSAFLQGDEHEMQDTKAEYAPALDELACAMNIPLVSAVKLAKALYGLGNAPRCRRLSVDRFLTLMGGRRTEALGTTYSLVAPYVDHFIITGILGQI